MYEGGVGEDNKYCLIEVVVKLDLLIDLQTPWLTN